MALQTLDQWIAEAAGDDEKDGPITMLSLVHQKGLAEQEIHTIKMGTAKKWTPKELAEVFRKKAENHAAELSGVQTFILLAFYGNRNEAQARKPFRINSATDLEAVGGTEGPTGTGLTQQSMRHMETVFQQASRMMASAMASVSQMNTELLQQNTKLLREVSDSQEVIFKLMTEKTNRDFDQQMKLLKHQRINNLIEKAITKGPAILNAWAGKDIIPRDIEDTAILDMMAEEIDIDNARKILPLLPKSVQGLVAARFERHIKQKLAEQEMMEKMAVENDASPEENAS